MGKKQSGMMAIVDKLVAAKESLIRHHARVFQMDVVTIALGRMGWGEKRFGDFDAMLTEVAKEYSEDIVNDSKDDVDLWYSKSKLDRELAQYVGSRFVPYDERYSL